MQHVGFFFTCFLKIIRYLEIPTGKSFFPLNQFNPYLFFLAELNITRWPSELLLSKVVDACRLRSRCRRRCCKLLPTAYPSLQLRAGLILYVKFSWSWPCGFGEWYFFQFYFGNVFSLFRNYLPLEKGGALQLKLLESPSPKDALCQVWLKLDQFFLEKKIF